MDETLDELNVTPGVVGSLIVGKDGLVITSAGEAKPDPDFLGAETAELFQNAEATLSEKFERGNLESMVLEASGGYLLLRSINEVTYLLVLARSDANLGQILYGVRRANHQLRDQL